MGCNQPLLEPVQLLVINGCSWLQMALKIEAFLLKRFKFIQERIAMVFTEIAVRQFSVEIGLLLFKVSQLFPTLNVACRRLGCCQQCV
ncbi:MAG: hypothetical protein CM15mP39_11700 [Synechococcus sp.]|nr:MAG: hypothetical protein CM15mP39_11700 [Synechococcus sp.]